MNTRRITLVASGLRSLGGHNYSYTRALAAELRERGFQVRVLAHKTLSASLTGDGFEAVFSKGTYDFPTGRNVWESLLALWAQGAAYADELENATVSTGDMGPVFCHTLSDFELLGWSHFVKRHPMERLVLMMRETPDFEHMSSYRRWIHPFTGLRPRAFRRIRRSLADTFVLATDTERLSKDYSYIFDGPIRTFPIPVPVSPINTRPTSDFCTVGYLGDSRGAKGFHRLAPMMDRVLESNDTIRFTAQLYKGTFETAETSVAWSGLEALEQRFPTRVRLVRGVLSEDAYRELSASLDVVLIPNDHRGFRAGSSNVFSEAAAAGQPVVVGEGTWMAAELSRHGGGAVFSFHDDLSFPAAVMEVVRRFSEASQKAQAFARVWQAKHNVSNLATTLLDAFGLEKDTVGAEGVSRART